MVYTNASYSGMPNENQPSIVNEAKVILSALRRHVRLIGLLVPLGLLAGLGVSYFQTPIYEASAQITLDPRRVAIAQPVNAQTQRRDEPMIDSGRADTELEMMRSEGVVRSVVVSLGLQDMPAFNAPKPGLRSTLTSFVGDAIGQAPEPAAPATEEQRIAATVAAVASNLKVERVATSYAFVLTYSAEDPVLAAQIANAFASAYIDQQMNADFDSTKQAVDWLKQRTDELSAQTLRADRAASEYQTKANISRSDGKLIDEKRLETLSEQLADSQSQLAEAQARYESVKSYSSVSPDQLVVTDSFQNVVITKLRDHYVDIKVRADGLAARFGERHEAVQKLRREAQAIETSIRQELLRYQETYKAEYEIALGRTRDIQKALDDQTGRAASVSAAQVQLNALEADARALRAAYDGYMQRYTDAMQRQSFPVSEARVISNAVASDRPSKPKRALFAGGGLVLGLLVGIGAAFFMEMSHRRIRTRAEAEESSGVECFGYIPRVTPDRRSNTARLPVGRRMALDYAITNPHTVATETFRTVKTALDQHTTEGECPVLGVVSCVPDEGKTTISANLAFLLAQGGRRVLLIDGDVRNPSLSDALASVGETSSQQGAVVRSGTFSVIQQADLPFHFIPAVSSPRTEFAGFNREAGSGLGSGWELVKNLEPDRFAALISAARGYYDYIVVDLPPIVPLSDVRATSKSITAFTMVMGWGTAQANIIGDAIDSVPGMSEKLIGSILNMADLKSLPRYGEYVSTYYNSKYFSQS